MNAFHEFEPIILLLRTLTDFDYQPKTWTGGIVRQGGRGEGPTTTIACSCDDGVRRVRGIPQTCRDCGGRGVLVVDAYTQRKVRTAEQDAEQPKRMVRCDECGGMGRSVWWRVSDDELSNTCRRCWGSGWVEGPSAPVRPWRGQTTMILVDTPDLGPGDPVIACMERRQLAGSYEELGLALAALRLEYRQRYRLLVSVFALAEREVEELRIDEAVTMAEALRYVRVLMPDEIRVPSWAARYEKRRREKALSGREEAAA